MHYKSIVTETVPYWYRISNWYTTENSETTFDQFIFGEVIKEID